MYGYYVETVANTNLVSYILILPFITEQIEDTKTLGSTESSTYEKKQLAYQSLKFNLENKIFQELFPDLCKVWPTSYFLILDGL